MSQDTGVVSRQTFTTGVQKESIYFQWQIPRLQETLDNPKRMDLQKLYIESKDKSKWHISLNIDRQRNLPLISVFFSCKLESATAHLQRLALWEVFVTNLDAGSPKEFEMKSNYKQENFFIHMQEKEIAECLNVSPVEDTLMIRGKLTIYEGTKNVISSILFSPSNFETVSVSELQRDMSDLLLTATEDEKFADVEFSMDDGTVLRAHRGILVARSDYFKAMLSSGMTEQKTGKISIEGINGKAMKALLHFLYSGCLSEDWRNSEVLHDLIKAAHRYQIKNLVDFLDANIFSVCDSRSAGNLLLLCKTLGMKTAENALRRLVKSKLKQIGGEPEFDDLLLLIAKRQNVVE